MIDRKIWRMLDSNSPGYLGKRRNAEWQRRDERFGKGMWITAWISGDNYVDYEKACLIYEDSYVDYFLRRPEILDFLCREAAEVYDIEPENVASGTDYLNRGDVATHIQDIAIRRALLRLGRRFEGKKTIQIRDRVGEHPLSLALSPGQVPFHRPELITTPDNLAEVYARRWWLPGSVEDFYQRNKRIFVRR